MMQLHTALAYTYTTTRKVTLIMLIHMYSNKHMPEEEKIHVVSF